MNKNFREFLTLSSKNYAFWLIFECARAKTARKSWDLLQRSCWVTLKISTLRTSPRMEVFLTLNTSPESRFDTGQSMQKTSIVSPFHPALANNWWVCKIFSNVQKNFTCRMDLASMCTSIFIRLLESFGIENRTLILNLIQYISNINQIFQYQNGWIIVIGMLNRKYPSKIKVS